MAIMPFNKSKMGTGTITSGEIRDKFKRSNYALQKEQWNYVLNRAFLHNEQWVNFDRVRQTVAAIPREPDRLRVTFNKLWPASRTLMAKLLSRPLVFEVAPSEADDASIRGSHVAESILSDLYHENNWEELREMCAWSAWTGGTSGLSLDWDQSAGTTIGKRDDDSDIGTGAICETPLNILEMGWEPGARSAEKALWWIRAQVLPPPEVQDRYGMKDLPQADATAAQGFMGRTLSIEDIGRPNPELTLVLTYYERPTKKRPQGVVTTVVNDKIVDGPHAWPFPFTDRLNLVVFRETKMSGKAHGETVFTAAVPVQVALNQALSNILEHLKLTGNARLLLPDTLDGIEELTDLPGEIVTYNIAGGKPEWMSPVVMPNWVIETPLQLGQHLDDILGIHDVSKGVAPSNIESGIGLSVLVEQDSTPIGALTREMVFGFERYASMVLETYAANVKDTRKARIRQVNQSPEVVEWNGASLAGQTDATIPMDAVMPRSRTALLAFAKDLWDRKIIQDPKMFAQVADLPGQDDLIDGIDPDSAKAQRENRDMAVGRIRVPDPFDIHKTHINDHNRFRKTLRYESLPAQWKHYVDQHIQAHERMDAEDVGNQVAKMNIHPALAGVATANDETPFGNAVAAGGGMAPPPGSPGMQGPPQVPSGTEGMPPMPPGMSNEAPDESGPVPS